VSFALPRATDQVWTETGILCSFFGSTAVPFFVYLDLYFVSPNIYVFTVIFY
jgi:hypothetical protein